MVDILLITGLSGAGKTSALKILEDYGYFAIDNLPVSFLESLANLLLDTRLNKVALGMDIRSLFNSSAQEFVDTIKKVKKINKIKLNVIYINANKAKILERFRNNKRSHPLMKEGLSLDQCIDREKEIMEKIKAIADYPIDTSTLDYRGLRGELKSSIIKKKAGIKITVTSFGYKYGIPLDADLVLDVRMLPNPFYVDELKNFTGHNEKIKKYLKSFEITDKILKKYMDIVDLVAESYSEQGRSYLNICIGCTGGHHRSVFVAKEISKNLKEKNYNTRLIDRDIEKEN